MNELEKRHYFGGKSSFDGFSIFEITGPDSEQFLEGQLTNSCKKLNDLEFQLTARLNRTGNLQAFGYLFKKSNQHFILLTHDSMAKEFRQDLDKFLIMEEAELSDVRTTEVTFSLTQDLEYSGKLGQSIGSISFIKSENDHFIKDYLVLNGQPWLNENIELTGLVTNTLLYEAAFDFNKGCYLGQETVNKIRSNRGSAQYPCLLKGEKGSFKVGEAKYLIKSLKREERVLNSQIDLDEGSFTVEYFPLFASCTNEEKAQALFEKAIEVFNGDQDELALEYLKQALELNPLNDEITESLGVLYGRMGEFEEGLKLMEKLLELNPNSVLAHTNKSLFYMKLGKIEEAEEEKAQATVKGFQFFGDEKAKEEALEKERAKEKEERERRKGMFEQVLEIDAEDEMALVGLCEIHMLNRNWEGSKELANQAVKLFEKNSKAFFLLGKNYLHDKNSEEAKALFNKAKDLAAKSGDLKMANDIQIELNRL